MRFWGAATTLAVFTAVACGSSDPKEPPPKGGASGGMTSGSGGTKSPNAGAGQTNRAGTGGTKTGGKGTGGSSGKGKGGTGDVGDSGGAGTTSESSGGTTAARGGSSGMPSVGTGGLGGVPDEGGAGNGPAGSAGTLGGEGGSAGAVLEHVELTVHTAEDVHAISPLIYGINPGTTACSDANAHFTLCRLGGNRWSTYNWENNASNEGSPLCFQNDAALGADDTPGKSVTDTVAEATSVSATTLVTVPILDYVAADKAGGSAPDDCSGDVRKTDDYLNARFKQNVAHKGAPLSATPDTSDAFVYQDEFLAFLKGASGSAKIVLGLDNQPGLWGIAQEPVHPSASTYAEVVSRNIEFATLARDAWPEAEVSGYVGYGWQDFLDLQTAPDATGNGMFIDYYLDALAAAQTADASGRRLIDYLDVHWYSEVYAGDRIILNGATDELVRARVQATRSLWDPTYVENSWIAQDSLAGPIRLIPRLKEHIEAHYPGTKLAISEWNYGGGADISGAVAAADALGAFGREGVGLAAWASIVNDDPFVLGAFRAYRNYDGLGAAFGDVSVSAASSDDELASIYASVSSTDSDRIVIIAINRHDAPLAATLTLDHPTALSHADVYTITSASPLPAASDPLTASGGNAFAYELPAYSLSVIVPKP